MSSVALLLLQAATTLAPPAGSIDDKLLQLVPPDHCQQTGNEIVVCAKDQNRFRLKQGVGPDLQGPPQAEWKLSDSSTVNIHGTQRSVGGFSKPAAMVTFKVGF